MKALIVIEIPEDHLAVTLNDLYERLKGYKCDLKPMPTKMRTDGDDIEENSYWQGWNECIDTIVGETE